MERLRRSDDHCVIPETVQLTVVLKELRFPIQGAHQIHGGDAVLGDTQPLLRPIAVLVELDGLLQCQALMDLFVRRIAVGQNEPSVGVGLSRISSVP